MDKQDAIPGYKDGDIVSARTIGHKGTCRFILHSCVQCRHQRWVHLVHGKAATISGLCRACSKERNLSICQPGPGNPMWKGGRRGGNGGYILVKLQPEDSFFAPMSHKGKGSKGYITEHRLIMAKHLGRCLQPWEIVHHKNGDKHDNRLSNLQLIDGLGRHSSEHNQGYRDGFRKGFYDGKDARIKTLQAELETLKAVIAS